MVFWPITGGALGGIFFFQCTLGVYPVSVRKPPGMPLLWTLPFTLPRIFVGKFSPPPPPPPSRGVRSIFFVLLFFPAVLSQYSLWAVRGLEGSPPPRLPLEACLGPLSRMAGFWHYDTICRQGFVGFLQKLSRCRPFLFCCQKQIAKTKKQKKVAGCVAMEPVFLVGEMLKLSCACEYLLFLGHIQGLDITRKPLF